MLEPVDGPEEENPGNMPDMSKVEYDVAMETIVRIFKDLRHSGLKESEAAAVVAALIKGDTL